MWGTGEQYSPTTSKLLNPEYPPEIQDREYMDVKFDVRGDQAFKKQLVCDDKT